MGVSFRVIDRLRRRGNDCVHLRDEGLQRMPNGGIFRKAVAENRIIITLDLDFGEIAAMAGGETASVVLFRFLLRKRP